MSEPMTSLQHQLEAERLLTLAKGAIAKMAKSMAQNMNDLTVNQQAINQLITLADVHARLAGVSD